MTKTVPLNKIKDNPYRDKKRNPVDPVRVDQLVESIEATDFWKGIYGREVDNGYVEIAFGHTRVDAARKTGRKEIPIEIEKFSDADMLMRMTRENLRGELLTSLEAVSAAVKAFGVGAVTLEEIDPKTRKDTLRFAPSFIPGKEASGAPGASHPYTADSLARFLGGVYVKPDRCAQNSVKAALGILEMEERKIAGFSERVLRTQDDEGVKYLGAKKIIQIVADVKDREIRGKERTERDRKAEAEVTAQQIRLEKERKEREKKALDEYEASLKKEAEAKREENRKEIERLRKEREEKAVALAKKENEDVAKKLALECKLANLKQKAEEAKRRDEYAPIRREVEHLLFKLETDPDYSEKSLSKKVLHPEDRERIRQAALKRGTWFSEYLADMFLPPLTTKSHMAEYQRREETKRRAEETQVKTKKKKKK